MSKQLRVTASAAVVLVLVVLTLAFGGGTEQAPAAGSERAPGTAAAPVAAGSGDRLGGVFGLDPVEAVALATATPAEWDYDPVARVIQPDAADLLYPVVLPESTWQSVLDPYEHYILRRQGTERAFTHPLNDNKERGIYYSRATGQPLFSSEDKYDSRSGWPSFTRPINPHAIVYREDNSLFAQRIEVVDSLSGSHLGHVFPDGPAPTGQRYCINGAALIFVPEGGEPPAVPLYGL